ncbi:helix-turn-helix transcriptional regulator [Microbacterium schleiferi]|uniref:Helix-turn-helix transcriptional regulator n=1 Tax=Microbacterium schleiferi TaxID=69362 RepID=A0A7S8MUV6_9MICO|nr:TetR/AcrR family transcriptional regulator [Microbacterium schleiferi]QPE03619.1 helix-turn-helix transcriptional regulator [Microbacterium schleiferi]
MPKIVNLTPVFDTTVRVLAERGYDGTTVQAIAAENDVSEVTLFRRFGTKARLIAAALADRLAASAFSAPPHSGDLRADLISIARAYGATNQAHGGAVMTVLVEASRHPELRPAIGGLMPNLRHCADIIATHQNEGRLQEGDPMVLTAQLLSPFITASLWQRAGAPALQEPATVERIVDGFLAGYGTP